MHGSSGSSFGRSVVDEDLRGAVVDLLLVASCKALEVSKAAWILHSCQLKLHSQVHILERRAVLQTLHHLDLFRCSAINGLMAGRGCP